VTPTKDQRAYIERWRRGTATLKFDALAATLGEDNADTLRKYIARLPTSVSHAGVEQTLIRGVLRRDAWGKSGPARDRRDALRSLERALQRAERDLGSRVCAGVRDAVSRLASLQRMLERPAAASGGRPRWRADTIAALRALGVATPAAKRLADLVGLDGPPPVKKPAPQD
jgi:hypothetical protein